MGVAAEESEAAAGFRLDTRLYRTGSFARPIGEAVARIKPEALISVIGNNVDDPGDSIGTIDCRCAVTQHLDPTRCANRK